MSQGFSLRWVDTHCHLDDPRLESRLDAVLEQAATEGVQAAITIATDPASSQRAASLAARYPGRIFAAVGFQPNHCRDLTEADWQALVPLGSAPGVVAIGETGLDRYWPDCPFQLQQNWFARHIEWSLESRLPLVIHMRECEADIVQMLEQFRDRWPLRGVMHSFTGSSATAAACLAAGLHISFAGMVTYRNAADLRAVAKEIPADRLLVETDSPYLSPEPVRARRPNEPALVVHTARCLADVRGVPLEELARTTTGNAVRLFGLPARLLQP